MDGAELTGSVVEKRIEHWKSKLLDISLKSRLINFKEGRSTLPIDLDDFNKFYQQLVYDGKKFLFSKKDSSSPNTLKLPIGDTEAGRRLYKIYLSAKESLTEQAVNTLYISFGLLEYSDNESAGTLLAPLVLVPVRIEKRKEPNKTVHPFILSFLEDDIQINPALRQRLLVHSNIDIDFEFEDIGEYFARLEEKVKEYGWKVVRERIYLSIFSFQKLSLYKDLCENKELAVNHPLVCALAGDKSMLDQIQGKKDDELAGEFDPYNTFYVLDVDSSQQEAIAAARKGISFVLQGPPGTGKSQTIANIIAQLLADGKKVLFVSEKSAALEVVKKRLDSAGLGHYILELHNADTAGKRWVLEQFEKSLVENKLYSVDESLINQLKESYDVLTTYCDELVSGQDENMPMYKVFERLAALDHVKFSDATINIPIDFAEYRKNFLLLEEIDQYEKQLREYRVSIFRHINNKGIGIFTDTMRESINKDLETALEAIEYLKDESERIWDISSLSFRCVSSLRALDQSIAPLINIPRTSYKLSDKWFALDIGRLKSIVSLCKVKADERDAIMKHLLLKYKNDVLTLGDVDEMYSMLSGIYSIFLFRWIDPKYRQYINKMRSLLLVDDHELSYEEVVQDVGQLSLYKRIEKEQAELCRELAAAIGEEHVSIHEVSSILEWVEQVRSVKEIDYKKLTSALLAGEDVSKVAASFRKHVDMFMDAYLRIADVFDAKMGELLKNIPWKGLCERLEYMYDNMDEISKWVELRNALDKLPPELYKMFEKSINDEDRNYKVSELYEKLFLQEYLRKTTLFYAKRGREFLDMTYNKFVESDREHKYFSRNRIIQMIESKKPKISLTSQSSELGLLKKEIGKSRRHKPLRKLFSEIKNLVFVLKPCFMMSPLSVARFIDPGDISFDVVIFDEASQIMVEDAISAIMRSKQAIIVGDSKQLPPTMFFKVNEDYDIEEDSEEAPSILDEASSILGTHTLKWHYRSRDESLIHFSNKYFYDNNLVTFPNNKIDSFAVQFEYVKNGVYERGGTRQNRVEAKRVVELIKEHFDTAPEKSLGVIAFSIAQQQVILEELEKFLTKYPSYNKYMNGDGLRQFFVKNLETVQGDERDVIILSVGYGRDSDGNFSINFGPINKEGGARRLNVAVSRAIEKVIVVSSILPSDIDESRTISEGVLMLKRYLEYALSGSMQRLREERYLPSHDLQKAVYKRLKEMGFEVYANIGSSKYSIDLAILSPDKESYAVGIEIDSAVYRHAKSVRDSDRIRREVLESLGWRIHRIWSYSWVINPEKEVEKILEILNMSEARRDENTKSNVHARIEMSSELSFAIKEYPEVSYGVVGSADTFMGQDFFRHVKEVVKVESPIEMDLLMDRIFAMFGIKKNERNIRRFEEVLALHLPNDEIFIDGTVVWSDKPKYFYTVRTGGDKARKPDYITLPELRLAILIVVSNAISISKEDIPREVLAIFGMPKRAPKFKGRVNLAVEELIRKGYLAEDGDKIMVSREFMEKAEGKGQ
ncbi:MAG: DUF3320 domain-containing protein [Candidatus Micrarchaeia archaeon]